MIQQKTKFQGLFEPKVNQPTREQIIEQGEHMAELDEGVKIRRRKNPYPRVKANIQLREEYYRALKQIGLDENKLIYEILDQAVGEYLERRQQINPQLPEK
jgi:flagellar basal body P-ring protein FlgI